MWEGGSETCLRIKSQPCLKANGKNSGGRRRSGRGAWLGCGSPPSQTSPSRASRAWPCPGPSPGLLRQKGARLTDGDEEGSQAGVTLGVERHRCRLLAMTPGALLLIPPGWVLPARRGTPPPKDRVCTSISQTHDRALSPGVFRGEKKPGRGALCDGVRHRGAGSIWVPA